MYKKINSVYAVILCLATALSIAALPSPLASAASWSPEEKIKEFVEENYPWDEIQVNNVRLIGKMRGDAPEYIIVEKGPLGKAVFSLHFKDRAKIMAKAHIRALGRVVKSKRPFRKGHVLRSSDVYIAKIDVRKMPGSSVSDPSFIIGKSLKRSVIANIPIVEGMIETSQVVKRGKKVVLLIEAGGFNISAAGKIKEKGYVGMPVRAINLSSKREVIGVLIDENTVRVEL